MLELSQVEWRTEHVHNYYSCIFGVYIDYICCIMQLYRDVGQKTDKRILLQCVTSSGQADMSYQCYIEKSTSKLAWTSSEIQRNDNEGRFLKQQNAVSNALSHTFHTLRTVPRVSLIFPSYYMHIGGELDKCLIANTYYHQHALWSKTDK